MGPLFRFEVTITSFWIESEDDSKHSEDKCLSQWNSWRHNCVYFTLIRFYENPSVEIFRHRSLYLVAGSTLMVIWISNLTVFSLPAVSQSHRHIEFILLIIPFHVHGFFLFDACRLSLWRKFINTVSLISAFQMSVALSLMYCTLLHFNINLIIYENSLSFI